MKSQITYFDGNLLSNGHATRPNNTFMFPAYQHSADNTLPVKLNVII